VSAQSTQQAASYATSDFLKDGRRMVIRALRPDDQADLIAAFKRTSAQSVFRRFFAARRSFSAAEIAFFTNADFENHVALVAALHEGGRQTIVGAGRYVVVGPGSAEVAFMVIDEYQGQGIGSALLRHVIAIAQTAGLKSLIAEVLSENAAMLNTFKHCGLPIGVRREAQVAHVVLELPQLERAAG
jgi:GNAT superfamily N-acetyltransferase